MKNLKLWLTVNSEDDCISLWNTKEDAIKGMTDVDYDTNMLEGDVCSDFMCHLGLDKLTTDKGSLLIQLSINTQVFTSKTTTTLIPIKGKNKASLPNACGAVCASNAPVVVLCILNGLIFDLCGKGCNIAPALKDSKTSS